MSGKEASRTANENNEIIEPVGIIKDDQKRRTETKLKYPFKIILSQIHESSFKTLFHSSPSIWRDSGFFSSLKRDFLLPRLIYHSLQEAVSCLYTFFHDVSMTRYQLSVPYTIPSVILLCQEFNVRSLI
jgi:hypothetical protein